MLARALIATIFLGWVVVPGRADEMHAPKAIDPQTVAAYKKQHGAYGGFSVDAFGNVMFSPGNEMAASQLPGFAFGSLQHVTLNELPMVQVPFGLDLAGADVKNADLWKLKGFKNLAVLCLGVNKVTDAGLKELKGLQNLNTLALDHTKISDAGLKELKELKKLITLDLTGTMVTDAGLKELKDFKNLTTLRLGATTVSDAGLKDLKELKNLATLRLGGTQVTDAGLKELEQALPKCKIYR